MERWREQRAAQAATEGLTLVRSSKSNTGFKGVCYKPAYGGRKPYALRVWEGHKYTCLGCFATAEEVALEYARRLGPRAAVAQPLTAEAAEAQAAAKGLTLVRSSESNTGFKGVYCDNRQVHKMFMVQVREGGKQKHLRLATSLRQKRRRSCTRGIWARVAQLWRQQQRDLQQH